MLIYIYIKKKTNQKNKQKNKQPTCFKNQNNPSCIDFLNKKPPRYSQNMSKIETGFFDFHKLVVTVLIVFYKTEKTKIIQKRNYITFSK